MDFFDIADLENFYKKHPDSIIFAFLAAQYLDTGQAEKALEISEKGVQRHPTYGFGHFVLGQCYYHNNNLSKAKTHLELSLAYDDKNPAACKLLGEINEKLDLPLMARESYLQYFTLSGFDPDAVEKIQQSETEAFNEFEAIPMDADFETGETERRKSASAAGEEADDLSIDDFFEEESEADEKVDLSRKVDEVFKESLVDLSMETDLSDRRSGDELSDDTFSNLELIETEELPDGEEADVSPPPAGEAEDTVSEEAEFDAALESALGPSSETKSTRTEEAPSPTPPPADEAETAEEADTEDLDLELDELFAEYDSEELDDETKTGTDEEELEFGNILFEEKTPAANADEAESDDILDYSSFVDEMMREEMPSGNEEVSENKAAPPADQPAQPRKQQSAAEDLSDKTRFGKPPILSPTLGEIYISQGRFEEAIEIFKQLLEKDPENVRFKKKISDIQSMIAKQRS